MIRSIVYIGVCSAFTLLAAAEPATKTSAPATQAAASDFDRQLDSLNGKTLQTSDLRAHFKQSKRTPLLTDPLVTEGTVLAMGSTALWRNEGPDEVRTQIKDHRLKMYYVKRHLVEDYPIAGRLEELAASPLPRLEVLRSLFTLSPDDGQNLAGAASNFVFVRLDPRSDDLRKYIDHVRVGLDPATGLVNIFEMTDPDGDVTTIRFSKIEVDVGLKPDDLDLHADGAKVVRPLEGSGTR